MVVYLDNTHRWGKYHCMVALQFNKFGFNCFTTYYLITTYFLFWSNPIVVNWRPGVDVRNFFGGNLENLDFPLNQKSKNRPF